MPIALTTFFLLGCSIDLASDSGPDDTSGPDLDFQADLSGSRTVMVTAAHPYLQDASSGTCSVEPFLLELTRTGSDTDVLGEPAELYDVEHGEIHVSCRGSRLPATEAFDMPDSVMTVPPGEGDGALYVICGAFFSPCVDPQWILNLRFAGFTLVETEDSRTDATLGPGHFTWSLNDEPKISGDWETDD